MHPSCDVFSCQKTTVVLQKIEEHYTPLNIYLILIAVSFFFFFVYALEIWNGLENYIRETVDLTLHLRQYPWVHVQRLTKYMLLLLFIYYSDMYQSMNT